MDVAWKEAFLEKSVLPTIILLPLTMPKCTRKSCGKVFELSDNEPDACVFHPGGPEFHEGLKSGSCCNEVNKPVMEFDQFVQIRVRRSLGRTFGATLMGYR